MSFSKQLLSSLFLFLFLFPLQDASNPMKCSSSFAALMCGPLEVPIRFPFCDNEGLINLHCNHLNKTVLELPMSGTFLVREIDYINQQIRIADPENCIVKRLLTFNLSGSPFSPPFLSVYYTFLTCPKEVDLPPRYPPVPCLSNSTSTFFVMSNYDLAKSMLPQCKIVQRLPIPDNTWPFGSSSYTGSESLLLKWDSPNCTSCEMDNLRCGFKRKYSLQVKCFGPAQLSSGVVALIISMSIIIVLVVTVYIALRIYKCSQRSLDSQIGHSEAIAAETASETTVRTGLDQATIDSYKKVELGESKRLSGTNGIVCPICLSEYASKETLRFIPECDHCFHMECIDPWLKTHGSCPLCRDSHT